ncbi:MAG: hypothetical protein JNK40_02730 [Chromatiales bacterium]|nr:hypothetical protein [Chromatiales bacterium]
MTRITENLLSIAFEGEGLATRSVPIYELASSLVAIQRIVHKTALFEEGKLDKGIRLPPKRREHLALQIVSHRKGSDLWGLGPYLSDPATGPILQGLVVAGLVAAGAYIHKRIGTQQPAPRNQLLVVNIYPEIKQLADRVGNIGGIDRITLQGPSDRTGQGLSIDADTQGYIRELEFQLVPGKRITISGVVTKLLPQSYRLDIEDAPGHYIRVVLDPTLFEKVRRLRVLIGREIRFHGIPQYKLGDPDGGIHEFHADRIVLPRNT